MATERDASADACPYVGLQPYREEDRAYFFGRERDIESVIDNLYAARLTVYYGASGVGKSSVLMAGVVPALRCEPRTAVVVFREWQLDSAVGRLKQLIVEAVARAGGSTGSLDAGGQLDDLLKQAGEAINGTVLLLLDQFEEYFLYHPESGDASFDAELARAVTRRDVDAGFVLSLREDALAKLDRFKSGIPNLLANRLRLEHLDRDAARNAICKPLERFAPLTEAIGKPTRIEPALVEQIIAETASGKVSLAQGAGSTAAGLDELHVETPFLQLVLTRLWRAEAAQGSDTLRLRTLESLGGAKNIVESHLDGVMDKLSAEDQEVCARFFDRLVTPSGGKIACRLDDLTDWAGKDLASRVPGTLALLASHRILRPVSALPGQPLQYEIFHDVLAASILKWRDDFLSRVQQKAEQEHALAEEKQQRLEAEARVGRILRVASVGAVALLIIAAVGWYRSFVESKKLEVSQLAVQAHLHATGDPRRAAYLATIAAQNGSGERPEVRSALYAALSVPIPREVSVCLAAPVAGGKILRFGSLRSGRPDLLGPTQRAIFLGCEDGVLRIYPDSGGVRELKTEPAASAIRHLALSRDGTRAVAWHENQEVYVWDLSSLPPVSFKLPESAMHFSVDEEARLIATAEPIYSADYEREGYQIRLRDSRLIRDPVRGLLAGFRAASVEDLAVSTDHRWLAIRTSKGDIDLYSISERSRKHRISGKAAGGFRGILFTATGSLIAEGRNDEVHIIDPDAPKHAVQTLLSHAGLSGLSFAQGGEVAAVGKSVRVWSPKTNEGAGARDAGEVGDSALSPEMRFAAIATEAGVTLWDYAAQRSLAVLPTRAALESELEFSPDGQTLAALPRRIDQGQMLQLWNLAELGAARTLRTGEQRVEEVEFASDGAILVASRWGAGTWELSSGQLRTPVAASDPGSRQEPWSDVAVSAEAMLVAAVASEDAEVQLWDMRSGSRLAVPELAGTHPTDVAFNPDGTLMAVGEANGRVTFFRVREKDRGKVGEVRPNGKPVKRVAFAPGGARIAITFGDVKGDSIEVWSTGREPRQLFPPPGEAGKAQHLAFSPDGKRIAVSAADRVTVRRLDPPGEELSFKLNPEMDKDAGKREGEAGETEEREPEQAKRLMFSPNSKILAVGGDQGRVVLWRFDRLNGERLLRLGGRTQAGMIHTLAFSANSEEILTTSAQDPIAKLWTTATGEQVQVLFSGDAQFTRAQFSRDGRYLAAGRRDGTVRLYPLQVQELVRVAKERLIQRPYTDEECTINLKQACPSLQ